MSSSQKSHLIEALFDRDALDCPLCCEPLVAPIYQCANGHIACSCCWPKLKNKCPQCALPLGDHNRCRAMERLLESVLVPCRHSELGCTKKVPYGRDSNHEKESCRFSLCSCPEIDNCKYTGKYNDIYYHYVVSHLFKPDCFFTFGEPSDVKMPLDDKIYVLTTFPKQILFVLQCFREPNGVYVAVHCIAPRAPEVERYSYRISYSFDGRTCSHESPEMKRIVQVSSQTPQDNDSMFVPNSLLHGDVLEIKLCISKLNEE